MKHSSSTYRLNMIKEVALKQQHSPSGDPMANYIHHLLHEQPHNEKKQMVTVILRATILMSRSVAGSVIAGTAKSD